MEENVAKKKMTCTVSLQEVKQVKWRFNSSGLRGEKVIMKQTMGNLLSEIFGTARFGGQTTYESLETVIKGKMV